MADINKIQQTEDLVDKKKADAEQVYNQANDVSGDSWADELMSDDVRKQPKAPKKEQSAPKGTGDTWADAMMSDDVRNVKQPVNVEQPVEQNTQPAPVQQVENVDNNLYKGEDLGQVTVSYDKSTNKQDTTVEQPTAQAQPQRPVYDYTKAPEWKGEPDTWKYTRTIKTYNESHPLAQAARHAKQYGDLLSAGELSAVYANKDWDDLNRQSQELMRNNPSKQNTPQFEHDAQLLSAIHNQMVALEYNFADRNDMYRNIGQKNYRMFLEPMRKGNKYTEFYENLYNSGANLRNSNPLLQYLPDKVEAQMAADEKAGKKKPDNYYFNMALKDKDFQERYHAWSFFGSIQDNMGWNEYKNLGAKASDLREERYKEESAKRFAESSLYAPVSALLDNSVAQAVMAVGNAYDVIKGQPLRSESVNDLLQRSMKYAGEGKNVTRGVLSFIPEAVSIMPATGVAATRAVGALSKVFTFTPRAMKITTGGLSFMGFEMAKSALGSWSQGREIDWAEMAGNSAKGFLLGAGGSLISEGVAGIKPNINSTVANYAIQGAGKVAETGLFASTEMAMAYLGNDKEATWTSSLLNNGALIISMAIGHGIGNGFGFKSRIGNATIEKVRKAGYNTLANEMAKHTQAVERGATPKGYSEAAIEELQSMQQSMGSNGLSWSDYAEVLKPTNSKMTKPGTNSIEKVEDGKGYRIVSYDVNGVEIERSKVYDEVAVDKEFAKRQREVEKKREEANVKSFDLMRDSTIKAKAARSVADRINFDDGKSVYNGDGTVNEAFDGITADDVLYAYEVLSEKPAEQRSSDEARAVVLFDEAVRDYGAEMPDSNAVKKTLCERYGIEESAFDAAWKADAKDRKGKEAEICATYNSIMSRPYEVALNGGEAGTVDGRQVSIKSAVKTDAEGMPLDPNQRVYYDDGTGVKVTTAEHVLMEPTVEDPGELGDRISNENLRKALEAKKEALKSMFAEIPTDVLESNLDIARTAIENGEDTDGSMRLSYIALEEEIQRRRDSGVEETIAPTAEESAPIEIDADGNVIEGEEPASIEINERGEVIEPEQSIEAPKADNEIKPVVVPEVDAEQDRKIDELLDFMGYQGKERDDARDSYLASPEALEEDYNDYLAEVQKEEPKKEEPVEEKAPAPEEEPPVDNSPQEQKVVDNLDEPMPMLEDGEPNVDLATPRRTRKYLYEESGLEAQDATDKIDYEIKKAKENAKKTEKGAPKMGDKGIDGNIGKFKKAQQEWNDKKAAADAKLEYWNEVKRQQGLYDLIDEIGETKNPKPMADLVVKLKGRFKNDREILNALNASRVEPRTVQEACMLYLSGGARFVWDSEGARKGLKQELGYGEEERKKMIGLLSKDGTTVQKAVHDIIDQYGADLGLDLSESQVVYDALLEALGNISTKGDIYAFINERRLHAVEDILRKRLGNGDVQSREEAEADARANEEFETLKEEYKDELPENPTEDDVLNLMEQKRQEREDVNVEGERQAENTLSDETGVDDDFFESGGEDEYVPFRDGEGDAGVAEPEDGNAPTFYSNAARAVEGIKQNKATAEQWLAMIKKNGGLKAGEDKWMGLSTWLDENKGKSLTKEEVQQFIADNSIEMEETTYSEAPQSFDSLKREYDQWLHDEGFDYAQEQLRERFGDDADVAFDDLGGELVIANEEAAAALLGSDDIINQTRLDYTTEGLENKREIAFKVPNVEPYQEHDEVHFGPENQGKAVMWVRFGETTDTDGKRVLVIDEIQSNRHQDARENGYINAGELERLRAEYAAIKKERDDLLDGILPEGEKWNIRERSYALLLPSTPKEVRDRYYKLDATLNRKLSEINEFNRRNQSKVPAAPFEKNWHEVAMKRMLRLAAEEGFDKVAWTTGEQQAERYDIGTKINKIKVSTYMYGGHTPRQEIVMTGSVYTVIEAENGLVVEGEYKGHTLKELFGKDLGQKIADAEDGQVFEGNDLRIGADGMKGFYDNMLPRFMDKYGKRWGVKTGEVQLATPGKEVMHAVDVTPEMKESVMQGQPLFRTSKELNEQYPTWLSGQTTDSGQHTTQITSTVKSYNRIGEWMKKNGMEGASVLDASSGLGVGTRSLREQGFNVDDVEPYPSKDREAPTYQKYEDIDKEYDVVISNAVLNVIPDDWRADVLKSMADKLKVGGRLIINVRDSKSIENQKQKIELDSPSKILVTDSKGNIRAYQKGFTKNELKDWVKSELGEGWEVEIANESNSGLKSGVAVVVTRSESAAPVRYRTFEPLGERGVKKVTVVSEPEYREGTDYFGRPMTHRVRPGQYKVEGYDDIFNSVEEVADFMRKKNPDYCVYIDEDGNIGYEAWSNILPEGVKPNTYAKILTSNGGKLSSAMKKRIERYTQREMKQARVRAEEITKELGLDVEFHDDPSEFTGRKAKAKGWYDPKTGKIHIVMGNHSGVSDVMATMLHEGVAHHGLRKLFGEDFDTFLDNVHNNVSEDIRTDIDGRIEKMRAADEKDNVTRSDDYYRRAATEEYLADLAEDGLYNGEQNTSYASRAWQWIKENFINMLRKAGINIELSDDELRYILWSSHKNLRRGAETMAEDAVMREKAGIKDYVEDGEPVKTVAEGDVRYGNEEAMRKQQESENFKNWFGDWQNDPENASKVVDKDGRPLVMSHNTSNEFYTFDRERIGTGQGQAYLGAGFNFSRTGNGVYGNNEMKVYLDARNPLESDGHKLTRRDVESVLRQIDEGQSDTIAAEFAGEYAPYGSAEYNRALRKAVQNLMDNDDLGIVGSISVVAGTARANDIIDAFKKLGFDSTIEKDNDGRIMNAVVFDNTQIKSATDNNGDFSRENPDIRFRDGEEEATPANDLAARLRERMRQRMERARAAAGGGEPPVEPPTPPAPATPEPAPELPPTGYDRPMSPIEMAQEAAIKVVADTKASLEQRNTARRELDATLKNLHKAMRIQKEYDRATVENVVSLCKMMVQSGLIDRRYISNLTPLFTKLKDSTGKEDLTSTVNGIMDVMLKSQERSIRNELAKLLKVTGTKVDENGVVKQAGLDIRGQHTMKEFSEYMNKGSKIIDKHIEDLEEKRNRIPEGATERLNEVDDKILGSQLAKQYSEIEETHSVNISQAEEDLEFLKERYKAGEIGIKDYTEQKHSLENLIRSYRMAQTDALWNQIKAIHWVITDSKAGSRNWVEQQKERQNEIRHDAYRDMQGTPSHTQGDNTKMQEIANSALPKFFSSSLFTLQTMLKSLGNKHALGEGYLYNRFFKGWMENRDAEITEYRDDMKTLNTKARELTGHSYFGIYNMIQKLPKMTVDYYDGGEMRPHDLDQGQLGYAYMVNKMEDGAAALRNMGITEEKMQEIANFLDPNLKKFYDWLQDDFLAGKWDGMNEVHKRLFGADMDRVANYIPLRRDREAGVQKVDISKENEQQLQSTVVGSIIKRVHSNLGIDLKHNNAIDVVANHLLEATHWKHFSEWKRDSNSLLSDTTFRNKVKNSTTIYGSGKILWERLNQVFQIAGGDYKPSAKSSSVDKAIVDMARTVNTAKVSMRVFTATKQLLSLPVFATECNTAVLMKNLAFLLSPNKTSGDATQNSFVWCIENLPQFRERWVSRIAGETRLENGDLGWGYSRQKVLETAGRIGLTPNAFIDACTVAAGAKSIYEKRYSQYKKDGFSEAEADRKAKIDAEIAFNESQQSSEKAFVAPLQVDRTAVALGLSTFRNASMGYERKFVDAIRNFRHLTDHKDTVEFMKKQMVNEGLTETQAKGAAERLYRRALWRSTLNFLMFGFGAQMAWNVGGKLPYLIFGDDDEEKKKIVNEAAVHAGIGGWVEGLPAGDMLSEGMTNWAMNLMESGNPFEGKSFFEFDPDLLTVTSDAVKVTKYLEGKNPLKGATAFVNLLGQIYTGVNPETFTDAGVAIYDACNGDPKVGNEVLMCILRVMQCPQSQLDQMYVDELKMSARQAQKLTPEEVARRYAYYKVHKDTPYMWWMYNQGKKDEIIKKYEEDFTKKLNEDVKEAGGTPEDYHDLMESSTTNKRHDSYKQKEIDALSAQGPEALMKAWEKEKAKGDKADWKYMRSIMARYQKDVYGKEKMPTGEDESDNYKAEHGEDLGKQAEKIGRDLGFGAQDSYFQMSKYKTDHSSKKDPMMKEWRENDGSFKYSKEGKFFKMEDYTYGVPVKDEAKRAKALKVMKDYPEELRRSYRNGWRIARIKALYDDIEAESLKKERDYDKMKAHFAEIIQILEDERKDAAEWEKKHPAKK